MEFADDNISNVFDLGIENELRFFTAEEKTVSIELLSGYAEIYGSELEQNTVYTFPPYTSISLFSWQGCSVKLTGKAADVYVASDSLIMISVYIHACLEEQRIIAESSFGKGAVSLIVGAMQSGKSSFCRFLLNYAARMGRSPLYIDLDVSQNSSSVPGAVSILPVTKPSHITEVFSNHALTVYAYGYKHPRENTKLYYLLIKELGKMVRKRLCKEKPNISYSGVVIDTFSWTKKKKGLGAIVLAAHIFQADVVYVIANKKLFRKLKSGILSANVNVVFVPRQKGIVEQNNSRQAQVRANLTRRYFYGSIQHPLSPYEFDVQFSDIQIYSASKYCNSKLDVDELCNVHVKDIQILSVSIERKLINSILGLSYADEFDDKILVTSVKGFICITGVDMLKEVVTILCPQPAPLPSKILILTSVKFNKNE